MQKGDMDGYPGDELSDELVMSCKSSPCPLERFISKGVDGQRADKEKCCARIAKRMNQAGGILTKDIVAIPWT